MAIKAVVFDVGGVLVLPGDLSLRREWEKRLGMAEGELLRTIFAWEVAALADLGQVPEVEAWQQIVTRLGLAAEEAEQFAQDFWAGNQVNTELLQFLGELRPRYKTALFSNAWSGSRQSNVHRYGLDRAVDTMILSCELGAAKPDPHAYRLAAEKLGVQPQEVLFVDDMPQNVQAAMDAGMHALLYTNTPGTIQQVTQYLAAH